MATSGNHTTQCVESLSRYVVNLKLMTHCMSTILQFKKFHLCKLEMEQKGIETQQLHTINVGHWLAG